MVTVYSITQCPWCDKLKKYLKSRNVDYTEKNIEENDDYARECLTLSGDTMVPVTTTDDKNFVLGFDKAKLDAMLGL